MAEHRTEKRINCIAFNFIAAENLFSFSDQTFRKKKKLGKETREDKNESTWSSKATPTKSK